MNRREFLEKTTATAAAIAAGGAGILAAGPVPRYEMVKKIETMMDVCKEYDLFSPLAVSLDTRRWELIWSKTMGDRVMGDRIKDMLNGD